MKTFTLVYDEAPPSVNHGARRGQHWNVERTAKRKWEGLWAMLLLLQKVPRGMKFCSVEAEIQFPDHRRRDSENYRYPFSKPFADTLVKGGWLDDDTDEFFELTRVQLTNGHTLGPIVKGRTVVTVAATYDASS